MRGYWARPLFASPTISWHYRCLSARGPGLWWLSCHLRQAKRLGKDPPFSAGRIRRPYRHSPSNPANL